MGTSYAFKVPVTEKLMKCFWPTLQMSLFALLLMILFSIPCGILSAVYQNKWPDYLIRGITFFGVSIPSFWIGLILLSIFGVQLRWVNVAGGTTDFKTMILPSVTLALSMSAKYTRQVRNAVLEELRQDYVIGARMRGIKESVILWRHVLPNAMLPIVLFLVFLWDPFLEELQLLRLFITGREWEVWQSRQSPVVIIQWCRHMYL